MILLGIDWNKNLDHRVWAQRGVLYAEVTINLGDLEAATAWSEDADIPLAFLVRADTTEDVAAIIAADSGQIVGAVTSSGEVAAVLRASCIPFELHAPVRQQIAFGASRITGTLALFQDFRIDEEGVFLPGPEAAFIRDREIPLVHDPAQDVAAGELEVFADHPYALLADMGYVQAFRDLSEEIQEALEFTEQQAQDVVGAGLRAAFAPLPIRQELGAFADRGPQLESN